MNSQKARTILDIKNSETLNLNELKHKYKIYALKYHPDKNNSQDATEKFQEIHSAYQYLCEHDIESKLDETDTPIQPNTSYSEMLFTFIQTIIPIDNDTNVIRIIMQKLTNVCETKSIDFIEKLDKDTLIKIYDIIKKNQDVFNINPEYTSTIESILNNKIQNDEVIVLNPTLEDLFDNNLYRLTLDKNTYIIPLWHHELQYDNNGKDLYVRCNPILLDDIEVDDINDIHIYKTFQIHDIWGEKTIDVEVCDRIFTIEVDKLKLTDNQTIFLLNSGISRPNVKKIYDVSIRSTIYIHVTLEL